MDFFEHQERARRKSALLVFYFIIAVMLIIAAVYTVVAFLFQPAPDAESVAAARDWWQADLFLWVAGVTLTIICLGTFFKIIMLKQGGIAVAKMLGAREVNIASTDLHERQLLNVVEEIALASGVPVPRVFLLEHEPAINAFAAGLTIKDSIIGITKGCLTQLTRDELQGVIAHEFSHILNGDMRLNIRLMGLLNGILIISIIGFWTLRISMGASHGGSSRKKGGNPLVFALLGIALMIIGYIGVFFGKLIKSAVSRQREYLADAAAVQFTRNPGGIAGALKKIGGFMAGSRIRHPNAEEASHLFFSNGTGFSLLSLMATHPPLPERIRRIDPSFDGKFGSGTTAAQRDTNAAASASMGFAANTGNSQPATVSMQTRETLRQIGRPQAEQLVYVSDLLNTLPQELRAAAHDPTGARALLFALLMSNTPDIRRQQRDLLQAGAGKNVLHKLDQLQAVCAALPQQARMPLAEMALTGLRNLTKEQGEQFYNNLRRMAEADRQIQLFEYMLLRMTRRQLDNMFGQQEKQVAQYYDLKPLLHPALIILSTLAHFGHATPAEAEPAFLAGARLIGQNHRLLPQTECGLSAVDQALQMLNQASPAIKRRIIEACINCVAADGQTTIIEAEMLRAIAAALNCPMPPFTASAP